MFCMKYNKFVSQVKSGIKLNFYMDSSFTVRYAFFIRNTITFLVFITWWLLMLNLNTCFSLF